MAQWPDRETSKSSEMRRVVIDTNLYVDWLNVGRHEEVLFQRDAVKYLSAVVMLELYLGAFSPRDRRIVRSAAGRAGRRSPGPKARNRDI